MPNISFSPLALGATSIALSGVWVHLGLSSLAYDCASSLTSSAVAEETETAEQKQVPQHHELHQSQNQHIRDHLVELNRPCC